MPTGTVLRPTLLIIASSPMVNSLSKIAMMLFVSFISKLSGRFLYFLSGTAASVSGNCENNVREVIVNGEIELESCSVVVWSDWTACPAVTDTCAGRPVSKTYRFSAHADTEHKDCPASTLACRKFLLFSSILFVRETLDNEP